MCCGVGGFRVGEVAHGGVERRMARARDAAGAAVLVGGDAVGPSLGRRGALAGDCVWHGSGAGIGGGVAVVAAVVEDADCLVEQMHMVPGRRRRGYGGAHGVRVWARAVYIAL